MITIPMKIYTLGIIITFLIQVNLSAQESISEYPKVGKRCPDFTLKDVSYFSKTQVSLNDFKGKWLILDFWNQYCGACIASFPKNNQLQQEFKNKIQFVLVGYTGSQYTHHSDDKKIRLLYKKFKEKESLQLAVAYDSTLFERFDIAACPYLIIINPEGIVKGITYSINANILNNLMSGIPVVLPEAYSKRHEEQMERKLTSILDSSHLINKNTGSVLYSSVFSKWDHSNGQIIPKDLNTYFSKGQFTTQGVPLYWLYNYAYVGRSSWGIDDDTLYGKYAILPLIELSDSSEFQYNYASEKGIYSYNLLMSTSLHDELALRKVMQHELKNFLGYNAELNEREMTYWRLIATPKARRRLITKGGPQFFDGIPHASFTARNYPVKQLIAKIALEHPNDVFINETDIPYNIDIKMDCIFTDLNDVKKALQANGLDLLQGKKDMKVIIIRKQNNLVNN